MTRRSWHLCSVAFIAGLLVGCGGDTKRSSPNNFVCFWIIMNPQPEQVTKVETLVREYPPASGLPILAGNKREAAVSVQLKPDQDASAWIDDLPDSLRHHELIRSVEPEDWDCGKVVA